jgi:hypothetical protein
MHLYRRAQVRPAPDIEAPRAREKLPMDVPLPPLRRGARPFLCRVLAAQPALLLSQAVAVPPRYRRHFRRQPLESGILMLYGNARRHPWRIGGAGIEEMEARKHSSSLLHIQPRAARARPAP